MRQMATKLAKEPPQRRPLSALARLGLAVLAICALLYFPPAGVEEWLSLNRAACIAAATIIVLAIGAFLPARQEDSHG